MKLSPLQIDGCYFTDVKINVTPGANREDVSHIDLDVDVSITAEPASLRTWFVSIGVKIKPENAGTVAPYTGELKVIGLFSVKDEWPADQIEKLVYINGAGLLYASVREMVCSITARSFFDMLVLPSWSFGKMYQELEENRKKDQAPVNPEQTVQVTESAKPA